MTNIDEMARRSFAAKIVSGAPADRRRHRFKALGDGGSDRPGRDRFAEVVAFYCISELQAAAAPAVRWYKRAEGLEKADYGSNNWDGLGFAEPGKAEIWLCDDVPNHKLPEIVAHETFHVIKHRTQDPSVDSEREAADFGLRVAAAWNIPDDRYGDLFVVRSERDLPLRAQPGSTALCMADWSLHYASHKGSLRSPRWTQYDGPARLPPRGIYKRGPIAVGGPVSW